MADRENKIVSGGRGGGQIWNVREKEDRETGGGERELSTTLRKRDKRTHRETDNLAAREEAILTKRQLDGKARRKRQ